MSGFLRNIFNAYNKKNIPGGTISAVHTITSSINRVQNFIEFMQSHEDFVTKNYGMARGIITSQVALETGYGAKVIGKNLFNIKCTDYWKNKGGTCVGVMTKEEMKNGKLVPVYAYFRDYDTYRSSVIDYINLIKNLTRYTYAWSNRTKPHEYFDGLVIGGYATDSSYARKLSDIYNTIKDCL